MHHAFIWLEDSQSLDSVANIMDFVANHATNIETLTFVGGETRSNKNDQELLGKALEAARTIQACD